MRVQNVTTEEERRNSTCLGFHELNKTIQTHHKTNNDWDVSQNPAQKSESTHKLNHFARLDDPMYSTDGTPKDHHSGIDLRLWTSHQIWAQPHTLQSYRRSVEQQALWNWTQGRFVTVTECSYCTQESWDLSLSSFSQLSFFTQNKWVSDPIPVLMVRWPAGQDFKCQTEVLSKKSPPFE